MGLDPGLGGPNAQKKPKPVKKEVLTKQPGSSKKLLVNLLNCKYEILSTVSKKLQFVEVDSDDAVWDLYWTDLSVSSERVSKMAAFQYINHFPGMMDICRKARLVSNLKRLHDKFPHDYDFFPNSWFLPDELEDWKAAARRKNASRSADNQMTYIVKPDAGAMGRGIYLVNREEDLELSVGEFNGWVAQEYISRPLLIDGFKFDLRIYVLVTSVDPLKIYIYEEGLARFATCKYEDAASSNLAQRNMHLTNYSVNKYSKDFVQSEGERGRDNEGSKRKLTSIMKLLASQGHNAHKLMQNIQDMLVKTIVTIAPQLGHTYYTATSRSQPAGRRTSRCFELLGFDVLLDQDLKCWVLEVNHSPSFNCDSPLDTELKTALLTDTVAALGLDPRVRQQFLTRQRKQQSKRLYGPGRSAHTRSLRHMRHDPRFLGMAAPEEEASSSSEEEEYEIDRWGRAAPAPVPPRMGGFHNIYPLGGAEARMAPFMAASQGDFEQRNECVCERCQQNSHMRFVEGAMLSFHANIVKLHTTRDKERVALGAAQGAPPPPPPPPRHPKISVSTHRPSLAARRALSSGHSDRDREEPEEARDRKKPDAGGRAAPGSSAELRERRERSERRRRAESTSTSDAMSDASSVASSAAGEGGGSVPSRSPGGGGGRPPRNGRRALSAAASASRRSPSTAAARGGPPREASSVGGGGGGAGGGRAPDEEAGEGPPQRSSAAKQRPRPESTCKTSLRTLSGAAVPVPKSYGTHRRPDLRPSFEAAAGEPAEKPEINFTTDMIWKGVAPVMQKYYQGIAHSITQPQPKALPPPEAAPGPEAAPSQGSTPGTAAGARDGSGAKPATSTQNRLKQVRACYGGPPSRAAVR